ncbi:hypothetical protein [Mycobacterium sp. NPDC050853]|uniref:hypothetical protein n=1 Tax=Mycobacterium sp. NPDC050853 TaxID=3155160 RepID=UPI0033FAAF9C
MRKWAAILGLSAVIAGAGVTATASADPKANPYPDINRYAKLDFEGFRVGSDNDNLWFSTPRGLNCGIWADGSFGCNGVMPGSPVGTNQIGWFLGDNQPHFDNTSTVRFVNPGGLPQRLLPRNRYVELGKTVCAVTENDSVYCGWNARYGNSSDQLQFIVGPDNSYLGAPPSKDGS